MIDDRYPLGGQPGVLYPTSENYFDALANRQPWAEALRGTAPGNVERLESFERHRRMLGEPSVIEPDAQRAARLNALTAWAREEYPGDPDHDPSARFDPERD